MGVPVKIMRLGVIILATARLIADLLFLMICPSSQTTRSAPEKNSINMFLLLNFKCDQPG